MKPRLCTATYTEEDGAIMGRIGRSDDYLWSVFFGGYIAADRRDAELMFSARLERGANPFNPAGVRVSEVVCGARWQTGRVSTPGYLWLPGM